MLLEVSARLVDRVEITRLGLQLKVPDHTIDVMFTDYANSLTIAANHILKVWFYQQNDRQHAHHVLAQALKDIGLFMIAREELNYSS